MSFSRVARLLVVVVFVVFGVNYSSALGAEAGAQVVMVRWQGINYRAHITSTEGVRYHIRYDEHREGRPDEEWVGVERLKNSDYSAFRPNGGGPVDSSAAPSGTTSENPIAAKAGTPGMPSAVPTGHYACYMFIGGTGLVSNGEFTLNSNGTYERGGASGGRFSYAAATGRVTFQGGVMDGRAAQYEGRNVPTLHLMGNAGNVLKKGEERPVASCERK